jgi:hypothetical protein
MPANLTNETKRVLEPVERISEFLFGLIMVLTLTCAFDVRAANHGGVRTMLMEALGCNVAWGMIDAFFYLLNCLGQRAHNVALLTQLREPSDPTEARRIIAVALPPLVATLQAARIRVFTRQINSISRINSMAKVSFLFFS